MTKYVSLPHTVEAIQMPDKRDTKTKRTREIAVWLYEHGYRDYDEIPERIDAMYVHEGYVLAEFGTNFITLKDAEGDEVTAHLGDFIYLGLDGEFHVESGENFLESYQEEK